MVFSAPPDRSLIVSRRVALRDGERLGVEPAGILVEAGHIQAVWPLDPEPGGVDALAVRAGARLVDFGDRLVTPAFVNAHTHLALGALRGVALERATAGNMVESLFYRVEAAMSASDIRAFARVGAFESLLSGVGLVWDHYYEGEAVAEALLDVGLAGVVAPTLQDLGGPGADGADAALAATEALATSGRHATRGVFAAVGPHASDTVSDPLWKKAVDLALRLRLPVHAHVAQSVEEVRRAQERHGVGPVGHLARLGVFEAIPSGVWAHGLYASREDLGHLARPNQALVYCPYSQLLFGFPARVAEWSEAGVLWAVATDCAASNDSMNVQKELRFVDGQRTVGTAFTPEYERFLESGQLADAERVWARRQAFAADAGSPEGGTDRAASLLSRVWSVPGRLHPGFVAGEIAPGALANLLVFERDHPATWPEHAPFRTLALGDPCPALHAMVVMGRTIGEPGDFHRSLIRSEPYTSAVTEASDRLVRLLERV